MMNEPPQQPPRHNGRQYLLGLGLGLIPVVIVLADFGQSSGVVLPVAGVLYAAVLVGAITCLAIARVRFAGYGLLTMFLVAPVIVFIGIVVYFRLHPDSFPI